MHLYEQQNRKVITAGRNEGSGDVSEWHMEFYVLKENKKSSVLRPSSYEQYHVAEK